MDVDNFIVEVQNRECLWNLREKIYSNREARKKAWEEIAAIFFNEEWDICSARKQKDIIDDLQKRWKNLRDYYVKEKKREKGCRSGKPSQKKRKPAYFESLKFLDVVQDATISDGNINQSPWEDVSTENDQSSSSTIHPLPQEDIQETSERPTRRSSKGKRKMTLFEEHLVKMMEKDHESGTHANNANQSFLLSLLPEVNSMTPSQQIDFKIQVMNIIKNIKYSASQPPDIPISPT